MDALDVDRVLGCGENLQTLSSAKSEIKSLTSIDKSDVSLQMYKHEIEKIRPPFPVTLIRGDCSTMPIFRPNTFDTVISSFTLCSVEDVRQL